jgi:DNA-directed RNA polymerase specialized sigma24 family protein
LSIAELAARLATTPETIKARLHRARVMAREYLA